MGYEFVNSHRHHIRRMGGIKNLQKKFYSTAETPADYKYCIDILKEKINDLKHDGTTTLHDCGRLGKGHLPTLENTLDMFELDLANK